MNILLTGGTGFIGRALIPKLVDAGHDITVLTRDKAQVETPRISATYLWWDPATGEGDLAATLERVDAVINLAGEPVVGKRWSKAQKLRIAESRCDATQVLQKTIHASTSKPKVLINASAIGYYGARADEDITEATNAGKGFLADTCKAWESHAIRVADFGVRVVRLRIGIVLETDGGALGRMLLPFKLGLGGPLGSGQQWMSWIHRADLVNIILFALDHPEIEGALNGTAPEPVRMREFAKTLARILKRPCIFPVPGFVLKILLGEMSSVLLLGQKVLPQKALNNAFSFQYPKLQDALAACVNENA